MVFVLVRALLLVLPPRQTSRSVMVRRGLAAAYASDAAPGVRVPGLRLANEQRFSRPALVVVIAAGRATAPPMGMRETVAG
jgi:hypothetical protein